MDAARKIAATNAALHIGNLELFGVIAGLCLLAESSKSSPLSLAYYFLILSICASYSAGRALLAAPAYLLPRL
jgi:hypothetical protein